MQDTLTVTVGDGEPIVFDRSEDRVVAAGDIASRLREHEPAGVEEDPAVEVRRQFEAFRYRVTPDSIRLRDLLSDSLFNLAGLLHGDLGHAGDSLDELYTETLTPGYCPTTGASVAAGEGDPRDRIAALREAVRLQFAELERALDRADAELERAGGEEA